MHRLWCDGYRPFLQETYYHLDGAAFVRRAPQLRVAVELYRPEGLVTSDSARHCVSEVNVSVSQI